ncbi:MAG: hypothetical protein COZ85_01985 [Candidatus Moranbacteria bacterium CG_4_8_14_3_um_filter_34_16]|nr:MAG: hypothetical protein COT31_02055 [Candidatus Moranbacteria bacterium CG08_land_8_20_14_0_20_34_16]PIW95046.1 MAG: hypothetical protein COZ85_01985 [Candidatus Moranbacteria bacterium CG_4_8_14_3_um_filter_34_16]PJA89398.1 MAG: hypothetical protein CO138_00685 [Candidatus Moranbacteria bacterium CG_4_9_14_3_um_filter_33_15]
MSLNFKNKKMKKNIFPLIIILSFSFFLASILFLNQQKNPSQLVYGEMDATIDTAIQTTLPESETTSVKTSKDKTAKIDETTEIETTKDSSKKSVSIKAETTSADLTESTVLTKTSVTDEASLDDQDINVTPSFYFSEIQNQQAIQNTFEIKGSVEMADSVEFFLIPLGSNTQKYIGNAKKMSANQWKLIFDSTNFPNGSFYLIANIKNKYGNYSSKKIQINISNLKEKENSTPSQKNTTSQKTSPDQKNFNGSTSEAWQEKYFQNKFCFKEEYCGENSDPDKDGLVNKDEFRYETNPTAPDSDSDGYLDGDEIQNGFNPLKYSPGDKSDKIVFESPKENGEIKKETYQVSSVKLEKKSQQKKESEKIILSGKGLPDSFINIYIYSSLPTILTVKTDKNGNWSYELEKQLDKGQHEVYVAITDNTGKITAKSEPLFFFKTAEAIEIVPSAEAYAKKELFPPLSPVEIRKKDYIFIVIVIISLSLILSIIFTSIYAIRLKMKNKQ